MRVVLVLAAVNAVSVVLLGTLCALRLSGRVGVPPFLGCLVVLFFLATMVWVRTERRHRPLEPLRRLGRVVAGLAVVLVAAPMAVLTPLFWLHAQLPPEANFDAVLRVAMAATLMALVLAVVVNAAGGVVIALGVFGGRGRTDGAPSP